MSEIQNPKGKFWKNFLHKIQKYDFIWSIPLSFIAFVLYGLVQEYIFLEPFYSTAWYHRAWLATSILLLFHGVAQLGIYFNFRGIFKYFYNKDSEVKEDFKQLPKWLKISFFPLLYFSMLAFLLLIFHLIKDNILIPLN